MGYPEDVLIIYCYRFNRQSHIKQNIILHIFYLIYLKLKLI